MQSCPRVVILLLRKRWNVANAFAPSPAFQSCAVLPSAAKLVLQIGQFPADSSLSGARIFNLDFTFGEKWCSWNNGHVPTAHFLSLRSINEPSVHNSLSLFFSLELERVSERLIPRIISIMRRRIDYSKVRLKIANRPSVCAQMKFSRADRSIE